MFDFDRFADLIAEKVAARLSVHLDAVYDIEKTARYLGVSNDTVYGLVSSGELPARKVGRQWCIRLSAIHAYLSPTSNAQQRGPESLPLAGD